MTVTAQQLRLDPAIIREGRYYRFAATGRFLEAADRIYNGLGITYRGNADGTLTRFYF